MAPAGFYCLAGGFAAAQHVAQAMEYLVIADLGGWVNDGRSFDVGRGVGPDLC